MSNAVRSVLQGLSVPSSWMVFRAQKGKAIGKGIMNLIWGMIFLGFAAVALIWIADQLGPMRWYIGGLCLLVGLFYLWSGIGRLREAVFGAIAITEDAVVVVRGNKEKRHPFSELKRTQIVHRSGTGRSATGMPVTELSVVYKDGRTFLITTGTVFGDPTQIGSAIQSKI